MINLDGNVIVEFNGHSFRYSNTATSELLLLLSNLLTEQPVPVNSPAYIALWNKPKEMILQNLTITDQSSMLTKFVDLARFSNYDYKNQKAEALFTASLTPQFTDMGGSNTDSGDLTLTIISQDKTKILAAVSVNPSLYDALKSRNIVNIRWTVSFSNKDETNNLEVIKE